MQLAPSRGKARAFLPRCEVALLSACHLRRLKSCRSAARQEKSLDGLSNNQESAKNGGAGSGYAAQVVAEVLGTRLWRCGERPRPLMGPLGTCPHRRGSEKAGSCLGPWLYPASPCLPASLKVLLVAFDFSLAMFLGLGLQLLVLMVINWLAGWHYSSHVADTMSLFYSRFAVVAFHTIVCRKSAQKYSFNTCSASR